jgi:hypothetical protein
MIAATLPTPGDYADKLKVYYEAGWHVDFIPEIEQGAVFFRGQQLDAGLQFSIEMERQIWTQPAMIPLFLEHSWQQLQGSLQKQGLFMPALVVWVGNNHLQRPDTWAQLAGLINRSWVSHTDLAETSFRYKHKISLLYGIIGLRTTPLYEWDVMELANHPGGETNVYVSKAEGSWRLLTAKNVVIDIDAAIDGRNIRNAHNLGNRQFMAMFPQALL